MNTVSPPMYGWNILLCAQDFQAPKAHLPSLIRGTDDSSQTIEEPDASKGARPVLKPSGRGDPVA